MALLHPQGLESPGWLSPSDGNAPFKRPNKGTGSHNTPKPEEWTPMSVLTLNAPTTLPAEWDVETLVSSELGCFLADCPLPN